MIYADTSFFVSNYLQDRHSPAVDQRMALGLEIFVTPFHRAEVANAIYQHVFRGILSASDAKHAWSGFEMDCRNSIWVVVGLPEGTFPRCEALARKHTGTIGVRTLDSLHVAAALELKADRFWTFDDRQRQLAEAEGLSTA
jgi:predicted nucleic acid-binding protein